MICEPCRQQDHPGCPGSGWCECQHEPARSRVLRGIPPMVDAAEPPELVCEVCGDEPAVGVAAVPGVPVSVAYGPKCLKAQVHPYELLVANTACCGGYEYTSQGWQGMVDRTLEYLGISRAKFNDDVAEALAEEEQGP